MNFSIGHTTILGGDMENLTGKQFGPYKIIAPLGKGGMAAVYKAYQPGMERHVALKVLPQQLATTPEFVGRFQQEAKVLAKLLHPHILPVFDFGESEGYTYIVMPFVERGTLTNLMHGKPLPLSQIANVISQVGDALDYAHSHGVVHRDVKPDNVLVDERGNCLLTDFGIAKILEGTSKFTNIGGVIGTPAYMSPEQGLGLSIDGRSDIYSLGIILYEMTTGRVPFIAETPNAVIFKHIQDPLPLPRVLNPNLPEDVAIVIIKALAKQSEDRFATAGDMVTALQAAVSNTQRFSRPSNTTAPKSAFPKWVYAVVGTILLAGMFGIFITASVILWASGTKAMVTIIPQPTLSVVNVASATPLSTLTQTSIPTQATTAFSLTLTPVPTSKTILIAPIGIESIANVSFSDGFLDPPNGDVMLGGVQFTLGKRVISSQASTTISFPKEVHLKASIPYPRNLYVLIGTGNGYHSFSGKVIGKIKSVFASGRSFSTDLVLGQNIREWQTGSNATVNSASEVVEVWRGAITFAPNYTAVLDLLTIAIPENFWSDTLIEIGFFDTSVENLNSYDPAIGINGVSISHR